MAEVTAALDDFDPTRAGRRLTEFIDDLSNWYVRRSRRRFWDGDPAALATLHECLEVVTRLLAPFMPFITDEVHERLVRDVDPDGAGQRAPAVVAAARTRRRSRPSSASRWHSSGGWWSSAGRRGPDPASGPGSRWRGRWFGGGLGRAAGGAASSTWPTSSTSARSTR